MVKGQMKIQQMAFMIVAVFLFFALVGLFFIRIQLNNLQNSYGELQKEQTISSLEVIANMPELNCGDGKSLCIDKDKLRIMSGSLGEAYSFIWPVASVKVYLVYPKFDSVKKCPGKNCNYYEIYDGGQKNVQEYSTFVSVCEKVKEDNYVYDKCSIGKLVAGVRINE